MLVLLRKTVILLVSVVLVAASVQAEMLVELERPYVGEVQVVGFELLKSGEIEIEAVGLLPRYRDDFLVYAWMIDHESREVVWSLEDDDTDRVGGRRFLREAETSEELDEGKYELYMFAGENWYSNMSIKGPGGFLTLLGDVFDGDDEDREYYDDYVEDCFVRISSTELSESDFKTFDADGTIPGYLIKHTMLGDSEYIQEGFTLDKAMDLRIYAVLEFPSKAPVDYGWIVDAETREKVWEIDRWNTDQAGGGKKNRVHDEEVSLDAGDYILYFVTDDSHSFESFNVNPPWDPLNWGITILPGRDFDRSGFHEFKAPSRGEPLIDFTRARNDEYEEQAFRLSRETSLQILALGEYVSSFSDYGWIQDAATGRVVWEMTRRNTEHAGGNDKNRMFDGYVTLPKGEYVAIYLTDGSHAYRSWNASEPFNPKAWGMAVYPGKDFRDGSLELIKLSEVSADGNLLVNITRVRDHERLRKTFTLDKDTRINIYALGEGTRSGGMVDYAYITDDDSGRDMWEMTWRNTYHAGGARKNRIYEDEILLDAGTYEVTYITDGSHSFNDWNDDRPDDPLNWGIKISIAK